MHPWIVQIYLNNDDPLGYPFYAAAKHKITGRIELEGKYKSIFPAVDNARNGIHAQPRRSRRARQG